MHAMPTGAYFLFRKLARSPGPRGITSDQAIKLFTNVSTSTGFGSADFGGRCDFGGRQKPAFCAAARAEISRRRTRAMSSVFWSRRSRRTMYVRPLPPDFTLVIFGSETYCPRSFRGAFRLRPWGASGVNSSSIERRIARGKRRFGAI